ncbi:hypothetical protein T4D_2557 [Trichinella pseudospiralis]|uniref:Uncharacterized protein n=1 Tax=Trichinella pseudospiralis TaxID=6337 RepID=A0A0V1FWF1_TRIPS|nr:hypothetical protein T4D_2557 [Trichinella pseudospiralis]
MNTTAKPFCSDFIGIFRDSSNAEATKAYFAVDDGFNILISERISFAQKSPPALQSMVEQF